MSSFTVFSFLLAVSCGGGEPADPAPDKSEPTQVKKTTLTVYSGRGESLVGELFKRIPDDAPFNVEVQYGKTAEMVTRLLSEGDQSPADIIFAQDSGHLGALAARNVLAELPQTILSTVDPAFRSETGEWVGTSGRLRVLVYDSSKLGAKDLPQSLEEIADPKWKGKLGWAPTNGSLHAHVSALRHSWGDEKTRTWLKAVQANNPTKYPKNSPQVAAANDGAIEIGWVNHYYLHRLDKGGRIAMNWSFPTPGDIGNVLMVAGVGIRKNSPNREAAEAFVAWLLSEDTQMYFAREGYEYPTRPGIATHPDVPPLKPGQLATVKQSNLADLAPTRTMLTELGLL